MHACVRVFARARVCVCAHANTANASKKHSTPLRLAYEHTHTHTHTHMHTHTPSGLNKCECYTGGGTHFSHLRDGKGLTIATDEGQTHTRTRTHAQTHTFTQKGAQTDTDTNHRTRAHQGTSRHSRGTCCTRGPRSHRGFGTSSCYLCTPTAGQPRVMSVKQTTLADTRGSEAGSEIRFCL